jgi:hypothetical protein
MRFKVKDSLGMIHTIHESKNRPWWSQLFWPGFKGKGFTLRFGGSRGWIYIWIRAGLGEKRDEVIRHELAHVYDSWAAGARMNFDHSEGAHDETDERAKVITFEVIPA